VQRNTRSNGQVRVPLFAKISATFINQGDAANDREKTVFKHFAKAAHRLAAVQHGKPKLPHDANARGIAWHRFTFAWR